MSKDPKHAYWHAKWQQGDVKFHQAAPHSLLLRYFSALNLSPGSHVLVPLCGKSEDLFWLAEQGMNVTGVELSEIAAKEFFEAHNIKPSITTKKEFVCYENKNIKIVCGDFFKITSPMLGPIDAIYDRAALIALPESLRQPYAQHLIELSQAKLNMLLITIFTHSQTVSGPPFSVDDAKVQSLYQPFFDIKLLHTEKKQEISAHLVQKGWDEMIEQAYLIKQLNSM